MESQEVFCAAEMYSGGALSVELVTAEGARLVSSGINGLKIPANGRLNPERAQLILVPGASGEITGNGPHSVPAILRRAMETELTNLVRQALGKPGLTIATVCGGSLLLAMAGLLEGRHAVTNHLGMDVLGATGAIEVVEFVDAAIDGNRLTWFQRITKPMRLNLNFEVTVNGNRMTGIAKAGLLPASKIMGERVAETN
ncbi:hypothetical protein [Laceyella putida]|uniref:DJ-1/PfpI family protein n=1 Tax=Laceyella putida TaxID=110101 RepID=A0ABW2RL56_9BACL